MSEITFIGLGLMGAALARRAQQAGHAMTVWNRSPEKMEPFTQRGARGAASAAEAVAASPLVVVCVENYAVTQLIFENDAVQAQLTDRTVVQLSTGTPADAVECGVWFRTQGARYLDGAVLGGPSSLATTGRILFAGPEDVFASAQPQLEDLSNYTRYVGENIRAAAALDLGWLCRHYGMFLGMTHAAVMCEAEGIELDELSACLPESEYAHHYIGQIHKGNFADTHATLATWASAFESISRQAQEAGINNEMPELMRAWFRRGIDAGLGEQDVAALVKVLR